MNLGDYDLPIKEKELFRYEVAIAAANLAAVEDAKLNRDEGTCVLGAGVSIYFLPPRARYPRRKILVHAPFQGNVGSNKACRRALSIVQAAGLEGATWYDGVID